MANLTTEQVREIIQNAPEGTSAPGIIAGLRSQGHILEGYDEIPNAPKKTTMDKVSDLLDTTFGGKKIGELIGGVAAKTGLTGLAPEARKEVVLPSVPEVAGDIVQAGATIAGFKGIGTIGSLGQRILTNIGLGATISGGRTLAKGGDIKETVKSAAIGGGVGGAIPLAGATLRAVGKQVEQLPARFVNSALSRSKKEVLQDIAKDKVDDFANYVIKSKPIGTANKLFNQSADNIESLSGKINTALASATRKVGEKVTIGRDNLLDTIAKLPEAEGALLKRADIRGIIERLAPQTKLLLQNTSLNLAEANKLRQLVDRTLGDMAFLGGQLSSDKVVLRSFANNLRNLVKDKAPEGTRELFSELANEIRFRDGLLERIARKAGNQVLSFGDFIGGGLGGIFGSLGAQPITGAVAGVATRRAIESVPFKIGGAKIVNALTKATPMLKQLTPAQQTAILTLFSEIFSLEKER